MIRGIASPPFPMIRRHHYTFSRPQNGVVSRRYWHDHVQHHGNDTAVWQWRGWQLTIWRCPHSHGDICT